MNLARAHHPGRPWLARATLVVVVLAFVALGARVAMSLGAPDLLEQKLAGAERYIYYRLAADAGPKFELVPGDRSLRLVTHAVLPPGAYDPARAVEYGVRVVVELGNGKAWTRDIHTRSRQSKARRAGDLWLDENTFVPGSSVQLTDDRLLVLALPASLPAGATARVTLIGDGAREAYVRAYAPAPRDNIARRVRELPDLDRARVAAQLGHLPWDRIAAPEQLQSMRFAERRLSAEGKDGTDYVTRTLFTTAFRLRDDAALERGLLITAAHGAAINVVGPARIDLALARPATPPAAPGVVEIAIVGEQPVAPRSIALPELGARATHAIDIPAGVFTLVLTATAGARVELATAPGTAVLLGGVPGAPLVPDESLSTAFEAPVEIAVDGPPDLLSRVLRIDLRALASEPSLDGSAPVASSVAGTLVIETIGEDGNVLATTKTTYESIASRLELAKLPGKLAASVCEPASVRFVVPPGGRRVRISSDKRALVQVQTPIAISPAADRLEPPYDSVVPVATRWRHARFIERGWLAVRPRAIAAERVALLSAQARLEPREVPPVAELRGISLPTGGAKQTILERVAAEDVAAFLATWDTGHYTRLVAGKPARLDLGRLPSRATVRYRADDSVGATARISVDGTASTEQVSSSRGTWRLASGLTGTHDVAVDVDTNVALLVDRPPAAGTRAELYAARTVSPVNGRVTVKVEKRGNAQQNINIVLYTARAASAATVRVTIDGGAPARVSGTPLAMWTLADRSVPLPPSDRPAALGFADMQGGALFSRRVVVALGDDLAPGTHAIEIAVTGEAAWLRLFTLDGAAPAPRARQWREATESEMP